MKGAPFWRRWLTGRGFGVHSPLAYRWVCHVLRGSGCYYAFAEHPRHYATAASRRRYRVATAAAELGAAMAEWPHCPDAPCVIAAAEPLDKLPLKGMRFTDGRESYIVDLPGLPRHDYWLHFK